MIKLSILVVISKKLFYSYLAYACHRLLQSKKKKIWRQFQCLVIRFCKSKNRISVMFFRWWYVGRVHCLSWLPLQICFLMFHIQWQRNKRPHLSAFYIRTVIQEGICASVFNYISFFIQCKTKLRNIWHLLDWTDQLNHKHNDKRHFGQFDNYYEKLFWIKILPNTFEY